MKLIGLGLLLGHIAACSSGVDPSGGGGASGGGGSGGTAPATFRCPEVANTWPMIVVPRPDGGAFCIDSREVTNEQYAAFLASNPSPELLPECAAATDPTPKSDWPPLPDREFFPVGAVTWCDAHAFCSANGKRLCGDDTGAYVTFDDTVNQDDLGAEPTEMWLACTHGGEQEFVYGNEGVQGLCNDIAVPESILAAGADTGCEGGYAGIFFLQGNQIEWEGACRFGLPSGEGLPNPFCLSRGTRGCKSSAFVPGNETAPFDWHPQIGFRCCADAIASD